MLASYPAIYRDRFGEEQTTICNDGRALHTQVRGVTFIGSDFDAFEPIPATDQASLTTFTFDQASLCGCELLWDMPIQIAVEDRGIAATLHVQLTLGLPKSTPHGGLDTERLTLQLSFNNHTFNSRGTSGWFEDELLDIQRLLPANTYLKACILCAFSDYSPAGHGLFGSLVCFRDHKAEYRSVKSKGALFQLWPKLTAFVQETHLRGQFERRVPGSGYRG